MNTPLAEELLKRVQGVLETGKKLSEREASAEDSADLERLYFELGSLVIANMATIYTALFTAHAIKAMMQIKDATPDDIAKQISNMSQFKTM